MTDPAVHIARLQAHADDQARIIRDKNRAIKALRAENSNLWCARNTEGCPNPGDHRALHKALERIVKAEQERDEFKERLWNVTHDKVVAFNRAEFAEAGQKIAEASLRTVEKERDDARNCLRVAREEKEEFRAEMNRMHKAEQERDEAVTALDTTLARAMKAEYERDGIAAMHAQQVKTIAELQRKVGQRDPSDVTDDMVDRFCQKFYREAEAWLNRAAVRQALGAALGDSPRPAGAEGLDEPVAEALRIMAVNPTRDEIQTAADVLADRGVRAVGSQS